MIKKNKGMPIKVDLLYEKIRKFCINTKLQCSDWLSQNGLTSSLEATFGGSFLDDYLISASTFRVLMFNTSFPFSSLGFSFSFETTTKSTFSISSF